MSLVTMRDYIYATPQRVLEIVEQSQIITQPLVDLYTKQKYKQIIFVASGSSYTAIHCVRGFICDVLKTEVKIVNPFTFAQYDYRYVTDQDFIVIVSQSGASTNCIDALLQLKEINHEKIVLTGHTKSDCQKYSDYIIDWSCGNETMGYVTLGVVTLIVYLMLFAVYCAKSLNISNQIDECKHQIQKAVINHRRVSQQTEQFIHDNYQSLMQMDRVYVLGAGSNYGTALEGALKMGETIKVLAVGYEQDEFLHGPALQLSPKYTVFVIDSGDQTSAHAKKVFDGLLKVVQNTYMITPLHIDHPHIFHIEEPCQEEYSCIYYLPFFQLIAEIISTDLQSKRSHPLYYEMNKVIDFRTTDFRKTHKADEDD